MSEQQLDSQSAGTVIPGPHLGEAQQADLSKVTNEPFAYFQFNEGWDMWEQVAHEHRHEDGVVAAYCSPPVAKGEAFSRKWFPHRCFAGEPMHEGQFREPWPMDEERAALSVAIEAAAKIADEAMRLLPESSEESAVAASIATAIRTLATTPVCNDNPWREAIIDALVVGHIYQEKHDADPRLALHDLLAWEVEIALDPRVSDRAAALLATPATSA